MVGVGVTGVVGVPGVPGVNDPCLRAFFGDSVRTTKSTGLPANPEMRRLRLLSRAGFGLTFGLSPPLSAALSTIFILGLFIVAPGIQGKEPLPSTFRYIITLISSPCEAMYTCILTHLT